MTKKKTPKKGTKPAGTGGNKPTGTPPNRVRKPQPHMGVPVRTDGSIFIGPVIQSAIDRQERNASKPTIFPAIHEEGWQHIDDGIDTASRRVKRPIRDGFDQQVADQHDGQHEDCGEDCPERAECGCHIWPDEQHDEAHEEQHEEQSAEQPPISKYCLCSVVWVTKHRADRRKKAEKNGCGSCGKPHYHLPVPTGPEAPPIMRLIKRGPGVIGYPWLEVVSIAPGDPNNFLRTTRYLCRLPGSDHVFYKWFTHSDLYGDGGDYGEYEEVY